MSEPQPARNVPNETGDPFSPWIPPFKYSHNRIVDANDHLILDMRGWGFLTGMGGLTTGASLGLDPDRAADLQDKAGHNVAKAMNALPVSSASTKPTVTTREKNLVGETQPTKGEATRGD